MAKRARRTKNQEHQDEGVIQLNGMKRRQRYVTMIPKNLRQEDYIEMLDDDRKYIVFAMGPAGTGKTLLAVLAAIRALKNGEIEKIVVTRPAVSVDEQHGFLPGTLEEKMAPWTRPIFDVFQEYFSPVQIESMLADNIIEIAPLAYMRGRTLAHCFAILDEAQNTTTEQMKMFLTRLGFSSKAVITGDVTQIDLPRNKLSGLVEAVSALRDVQGIGMHFFSEKDVVRHPLVQSIVLAYKDHRGSRESRI